MRNYWIKILLGALGIFVIGMLGVSAVRRGHTVVHDVVDGTGPISIPLPSFVPFNLDGVRLGSVRRLTIFRSAAQKPSHLSVSVQLPDSVTSERLSRCILVVESLEHVNEHTSFRCAAAGDTAGKSLVPFGTVALRGRSDSFPLLLPRQAVEDMTKDHDAAADTTESRGDRLADSILAAVDTAVNNASGRQEQVRQAGAQTADSVRRVWHQRADSIRRAAPGR